MTLFATAIYISISFSTLAQTLTASGMFGLATPLGRNLEDLNGEKLKSLGATIDGDLLYHPQINNQLGLGIMILTSFLRDFSTSGSSEIGLYGANLYGAKAHYKFSSSQISPYVSLSAGLCHYSVPVIFQKVGLVPISSRYTSFGLRPELGLHLGGLLLSAAYCLPTKSLSEEVDFKGVFQISVGFRIKIADF